jgi:hypothetical protein
MFMWRSQTRLYRLLMALAVWRSRAMPDCGNALLQGPKEDKMKSLAICAALIGGFGALVFMGTVASTVPASAKCFVDEGNGRRTPCDAMYKKHKPAAKTSKAKKDVKPK